MLHDEIGTARRRACARCPLPAARWPPRASMADVREGVSAGLRRLCVGGVSAEQTLVHRRHAVLRAWWMAIRRASHVLLPHGDSGRGQSPSWVVALSACDLRAGVWFARGKSRYVATTAASCVGGRIAAPLLAYRLQSIPPAAIWRPCAQGMRRARHIRWAGCPSHPPRPGVCCEQRLAVITLPWNASAMTRRRGGEVAAGRPGRRGRPDAA